MRFYLALMAAFTHSMVSGPATRSEAHMRLLMIGRWMMEEIEYSRDQVSIEEFRSVLIRSGLGDRRPVDDAARLQGMLDGAQLVVTARSGGRLVGIARAVTDWTYCCYVSDLAVDRDWQGRGIGRRLLARTRLEVGASCTIVLVSAPDAIGFYERTEFTRSEMAFVLPRTK